MSLMLWDPFLFNERPLRARDTHVLDSDKEIMLEIDAPGMKPEDILVSVDKDTILIEGSHKSARRTRAFSKRYTLPETVDEAGISAKLADGVLSLTFPKRELPAARKIAVLTA